jgi:hypothetical protein
MPRVRAGWAAPVRVAHDSTAMVRRSPERSFQWAVPAILVIGIGVGINQLRTFGPALLHAAHGRGLEVSERKRSHRRSEPAGTSATSAQTKKAGGTFWDRFQRQQATVSLVAQIDPRSFVWRWAPPVRQSPPARICLLCTRSGRTFRPAVVAARRRSWRPEMSLLDPCLIRFRGPSGEVSDWGSLNDLLDQIRADCRPSCRAPRVR